MGGHLDSSILGSLGLVGATCAFFPMVFSAPVFPTSPPQTINSGESTLVTIKGTGFGAAPSLSFSDPTVSLRQGRSAGRMQNGVTTVTGTMTSAPVPAPIPFNLVPIPVTITSSLPPPSTPANQNVLVWPVNTTLAVAPVNPTLLVSQSQQFTPTLTCLTRGGQSCTCPEDVYVLSVYWRRYDEFKLFVYRTCISGGTGASYGKGLLPFGNTCTGFSLNLVPVSVAVSPSAVSLKPVQSQQFQATVTNAPNNNQG